jgi:hypothetical protein
MAKVELLEHHVTGLIPRFFGNETNPQKIIGLIEKVYVPFLRGCYCRVDLKPMYPFLFDTDFNESKFVRATCEAVLAKNQGSYNVITDQPENVPEIRPDHLCGVCGNLIKDRKSVTGYFCRAKVKTLEILRVNPNMLINDVFTSSTDGIGGYKVEK